MDHLSLCVQVNKFSDKLFRRYFLLWLKLTEFQGSLLFFQSATRYFLTINQNLVVTQVYQDALIFWVPKTAFYYSKVY